MSEIARRTEDSIRAVAQSALDVILMKLLRAAMVDPHDPRHGVSIEVTADGLNAVDTMHAGSMATILEVTAYLALLPDLAATEDAATHGFSASYIRPALEGDRLVCTASVVHRSGRLAFVNAQLMRGDEVIATASVTKSIIRASSQNSAVVESAQAPEV
jgi:uncharacterized protein (TIGR00369 family)